MHISHTIEQLEAARSHDSRTNAVRIIRSHLTAAGLKPTLGTCADLARRYWQDPETCIALLHAQKPN